MARDDLTARDLVDRPHSWREFEPREFVAVADNQSKSKARRALKRVEAGRFYEALNETHRFFAALDADEKRDWADANPDMATWIGAWGYVNDQKTFEEYTGIEPFDFDLDA